jgi:hypothetical protein
MLRNIYKHACMQVNYLRWWRAGGQKGGETEQLCTPYLTANCVTERDELKYKWSVLFIGEWEEKWQIKNHMH